MPDRFIVMQAEEETVFLALFFCISSIVMCGVVREKPGI